MALIFEQIQTPGIALLSYLVGDDSTGTAALIDPRADVQCYLELARQKQVSITHIFETHIHADFVGFHPMVFSNSCVMIRVMNLIIILLVLLLLFGGGGFYLGGAAVGGGLLGLILVVALIVYLMGGFRRGA